MNNIITKNPALNMVVDQNSGVTVGQLVELQVTPLIINIEGLEQDSLRIDMELASIKVFDNKLSALKGALDSLRLTDGYNNKLQSIFVVNNVTLISNNEVTNPAYKCLNVPYVENMIPGNYNIQIYKILK